MQQQGPCTYRMTVDASGRVVIPAEVRQRHGIQEGDVVMGYDDSNGITIRSLEEVLAISRDYYRSLTPKGTLLSDEINADRRSENERD